jgi:hypothetical protein
LSYQENAMPSRKLMLLLPLAALAVPPSFAQEAKVAPPAHDAASQEGLVVVRDAETGELRAPTPEEFRALRSRPSASAAAAATAPAAPRMIIGADGRRTVNLDERHMVYSVVTRDADGKLTDQQCVHGAHAAKGALAQPASPTKSKERQHESR